MADTTTVNAATTVPESEAAWEAAETADRKRRNRRTLAILAGVGLGMFGFAFANSPLFDLLCAAVGIQQNPNAAYVQTDGEGREIEVRFMANVHGDMPIAFSPVERRQKVILGQPSLNDYKFVNMTDEPIYFQPVHSITPVRKASEKFMLNECFCFDNQKLRPNESVSLPVNYTIGTDLDGDVDVVTLNYTLFEITARDYYEWLEAEEAKEAAGIEDDKKVPVAEQTL